MSWILVAALLSYFSLHARGRAPLEVGVCITGQMQRFEVDSKVEHLFRFGTEKKYVSILIARLVLYLTLSICLNVNYTILEGIYLMLYSS